MTAGTNVKSGLWEEWEVIALLRENDEECRAGIAEIYRRQTDDEKRTRDTKWLNDIGFTTSDAKRGSVLAAKIIARMSLSSDEMRLARKLALRYSRQLTEIRNGVEGDPTPKK